MLAIFLNAAMTGLYTFFAYMKTLNVSAYCANNFSVGFVISIRMLVSLGHLFSRLDASY